MTIFQKAVQWARKSFPFPGRRFLFFPSGLPDERDYSRLVGDGGNNSIVSGCIQFIMRTFPEAPPAVWKEDSEGLRQREIRSDLVTLLKRPNPFYSGVHLWMATLLSWFIDGNAYWLKVRNSQRKVIQLWYVPHWLMQPDWPQHDASVFISRYLYSTNGGQIPVPPEDVVHLRWGLNPENVRMGQSPLHAVMREVYTDEEAARFSASVLHNMGIPGVVISPAPSSGGLGLPMGTEDAKAAKEKFKQDYGADRRGEPIIFTKPTQIQTFGFSPQQLDLSALRDVPEERVTAALGLPAAVVGFGTGLQQTKVGATMAELRDQSWEGCLIPSQRIMSADIDVQLLPEFYAQPELYEFGFDLTRVRALQEDKIKMAQRQAVLFLGDIIKRKEARAQLDYLSGPEDDVYASDLGIPLSPRGIPVPPKISVDATALTDGAGTGNNADSQQAINELTQQVNDLQSQIDGMGKADPMLTASVERLNDSMRELKARKDGPPTFNIVVPEREVNIDNTVNVPERQMTIDARTTVEPGAVVVNQDAPKGGGIDIVRDASGKVVGARPVE